MLQSPHLGERDTSYETGRIFEEHELRKNNG